MSNLTKTAQVARQAIFIGSILLIVIVIATLSFKMLPASSYQTIQSTPTPKPDTLYGKLPPLPFPKNSLYPTNIKLETIQGGPPISTSSAYVYFVPKKVPNLFSKKNAKQLANKLGFSNSGTQSDLTLSYQDPEREAFLTIDIPTQNFNFIRKKIPEFSSSFPISQDKSSQKIIVQMADFYFSLLNEPIDHFTDHIISYFKINNNTLEPVQDRKQAQIARVDYINNTFDGFPLIRNNMDKSATYISFLLTNENEKDIQNIIEASYQEFPPDELSKSIYPTINGKNAWQALVSGKAYIETYTTPNVIVRDGYIAYYQAPIYIPYLQPVYVFKGDGGFTAFVPAVDPSWIGN